LPRTDRQLTKQRVTPNRLCESVYTRYSYCITYRLYIYYSQWWHCMQQIPWEGKHPVQTICSDEDRQSRYLIHFYVPNKFDVFFTYTVYARLSHTHKTTYTPLTYPFLFYSRNPQIQFHNLTRTSLQKSSERDSYLFI